MEWPSWIANTGFMPHGHCYLWNPGILWTQVVSEAAIGLAYFAIPLVLFRLVRQNQAMEFRRLFLLFALFILFCGATHLLAIVNIWNPHYYLDSLLKVATALVSIIAALRLKSVLPQLLALPNPSALEAANATLETLVKEREAAGEERFRLALEASPNSILVADAQGKIAFVNAQTEIQFGYSRQDLLNQPLEILIPHTARAIHGHHVHGFRSHPQMRSMGAGREVRGLRKDGSEFDAEIALGPFHYAGQLNVIAFVADITSRKANEAQIMRQSADLERSNQDLESFAYAASHDLQEPLRGMMGYLQLLQRQFGPGLAPKAARYLEQALDAGGRMRTLMEALLQYSRIGRHREAQEITLGPLLQVILHDLHTAIHESGAKVHIEAMPTVRFNPLELRQIFQNLLSNALKFRGEASPEVRILMEMQNGEQVFRVKDNGIGIPEEFQGKLFQIFQRLHARSSYPGSGIGLALVAKAIRSHGGRIWVESKPGVGTTFSFSLGPQSQVPRMSGK